MYQDTSVEAYHTLTDKARMQRKVLEYIYSNGPVCDMQVAIGLSLPISSITPRRGELVKMGKVAEVFRTSSPVTGRRVIFWMATATALSPEEPK